MKIEISRQDAPKTRLNIEVISEIPGQLGAKRGVAFILPGGPGASLKTYKSYRCLQEVVDLVFFDPRGCGDSDRGDQKSYTAENYIEDVESIRKHLGLDRISLVGKSYGSMCALGYALRYSDSMDKLVLAAGAPSWRFIETAKENLKRDGTPEQIAIVEKLWRGELVSEEEALTFFKLTQPLYSVKARTQPVPIESLIERSKNLSLPVLNEGFKNEVWHFDYEKQLDQVTCPTLVLAGRQDWVNDLTHTQFMADHIPHCQFVVFDEASHAMEADVPEEFFQRIADFLA